MRLHLWCFTALALSSVVHADRILFVASNATDQIDTLFTMNPDGTDVQRVYTNMIRAWSPDLVGTHLTNAEIVFTDITRPASNIFIVPLIGGTPVSLNNTNKAICARFHGPDKLYYLRPVGGFTYQVWTINRNGSGERMVFTNNYQTWPIGTHSFSISDTNIYIVNFVSFSSRIFRGATNALTAVDIYITTNMIGDRYNVAVSPGGLRLAYCADGGTGDHRIAISPNIPGTLARNDIAPVYAGSPAWSPDASWLAFIRAPASTFGSSPYIGWLCTVTAAGTGETNLTQGITSPFIGNSCGFPVIYNVIPEASALSGLLLVATPFWRRTRR